MTKGEVGSPWLLHDQFANVLETLELRFNIHGSDPDFQGGRYEGNMIHTTPVNKRRGKVAGPGEVMAFLSVLPGSLQAVPVKYLHPSYPGPDDAGLVFKGEHSGRVLDFDYQTLPGNILLGRARDDRSWVPENPLNCVVVRGR